MSHAQIASGTAPGNGRGLSADNAFPERHIVIDTLRSAAPLLGLRAPVIATLDAMLSCLAPRRSHHTVFASNATLAFRRNGISERTLRRHVEILRDARLLTRHDSPNGKRYTRHDPVAARTLRFGFDLSPLFDRLHEIATLATRARQEQERIAYLKCKIRAVTSAMLEEDPDSEAAQRIRTLLRRRLTVLQCDEILAALTSMDVLAHAEGDAGEDQAERMSASDGENVRHHHKSNIELTDKKAEEPAQRDGPAAAISVRELIAACPDASEFSLNPVATHDDVIAHASTLAPMLGIGRQEYDAARLMIGPFETALTIWAIVQFHGRIRSIGAYFRSITTGSRSEGFDPVRLIRQLGSKQAEPA